MTGAVVSVPPDAAITMVGAVVNNTSSAVDTIKIPYGILIKDIMRQGGRDAQKVIFE